MATSDWMWLTPTPATVGTSVGYLVRFRTEVHLVEVPTAPVPLRISAEDRYRLFVNGELITAGPAKPLNGTWFVDTVDISSHLTSGPNVIGIEALAYPDTTSGNVSLLRGPAPGLLVDSSSDSIDLLRTAEWRAHFASGRTFLQGTNTLFLGIQEAVEAEHEPSGWLAPGYDDFDWTSPVRTSGVDTEATRTMAPRDIPMMTMEPVSVRCISRHRGSDPGWEQLLRDRSVTIPAGEEVDVDLDLGVLQTAFVELVLSGGAGSTIRIIAAESYEGVPIDLPWMRRKSDRTDSVNGDIYGDPDVYITAGTGTGTAPECYSPFWFRTLRYLRVSIHTTTTALTIGQINFTRTNYPLAITGSFNSSAKVDSRLWTTSERTLLNCMHETFEDCPFYEQLQYAMDTRSQALFSLHLSDDDRLIRRAIASFASSGSPDGLTESRAPSVRPQIIPGFSLFWVFMVAEHLSYVGDRGFTAQYLDRVDAVLSLFSSMVADDGFVLSPPDLPAKVGAGEVWNFVDWTTAWKSSRGVPDLGQRRANTIVTFQFITALRMAAEANEGCGFTERAARYRRLADQVSVKMASNAAWDPITCYYRDSDHGRPVSQHAQVWAVLAGTVNGDAAKDLLARAVRDPALTACSYAMSHSLFDALRLAGAHDLVDWQPWIDMLRVNLTTWAEDTISNRSDCHAWGSVPLQHFPRWVLGVHPLAPGYARTGIEPSPSRLDYAEGTVPTPHGLISVRWDKGPSGSMAVRVRAPQSIELVLPSTSSRVHRWHEDTVQVVEFDHHVGEVESTRDPRTSVAHL